MAFRGYELNLVLRVQDRASSRLRRLASDVGNVSRSAQMANARIANQQKLWDKLNTMGTEYEAKKAQLIQKTETLNEKRVASERKLNADLNALGRKRIALDEKIATREAAIKRRALGIDRKQSQIRRMEAQAALDLQQLGTAGYVQPYMRAGKLVKGYAKAGINTQEIQLMKQQADIASKEQRLIDEKYRALGRQTVLEQKLNNLKLAGQKGAISNERLLQLTESKGFGARKMNQRKAILDLLAVRTQLGRIEGDQENILRQTELWERKFAELPAAQQKLLAGAKEQILAIQRANAELEQMNVEYTLAQAKLSRIVDEYALIGEEEAAINGEHALRLEQLAAEERELKVILGDLVAMQGAMRRIQQTEMPLAAAVDAVNVKRMAAQHGLQTARAVSHVGSAMTVAGGISTASFGIASAMFASFDTAVAHAVSQTGAANESFALSEQKIKALEKAIVGMASKFPTPMKDMAQAAYNLFSSINLADTAMQRGLGVSENMIKNQPAFAELAAGTKLLTVANQVAVAGQTDLAGATSALITVVNNFDPTLKNLTKTTDGTMSTLDQMFAIVRFGRMEFSDFNDLMNQLAPAAFKADQSLIDVGAAAAQLTKQMPSQAQAGTSLARLLDVLSRPDFQAGMEKLGLSITKVGADGSKQLLPLYDIITKIHSIQSPLAKSGVLPNSIIQILTSIGAGTGKGVQSTSQARRALVLLLKTYEQYGVTLKQIGSFNNEFYRELKIKSESAEVKWKVFVNSLKAVAIVIGEQALPAFIKFGEWIQKVVKRWQGLPSGVRHAIVYFTAFASIAALVGGLLLSVVAGIGALYYAFKLFTAGLGPLAGEGALGRAAKMLIVATALKKIGIITIGVHFFKSGDHGLIHDIEAGVLGMVGGRKAAKVIGKALPKTLPYLSKALPVIGTAIAELAGPLEGGSGDKSKESIAEARRRSYEKFRTVLDQIRAANRPKTGHPTKTTQLVEDALDKFLRTQMFKEVKDPKTGRKYKVRLNFFDPVDLRSAEIKLMGWVKMMNQKVSAVPLTTTIKTKADTDSLTKTIEEIKKALNFKEFDKKTQALVDDALNRILGGGGGAGSKLTAEQKYAKAKLAYDRQVAKASVRSRIAAETMLANWEKAKTSADRAALKAGENARIASIKKMTKFIMDRYKEIEQKNKDIMGGIFGGPISTGPIASAFNDINSKLAGLGIKPLSMPMNLILQDQKAAIDNFQSIQDAWQTISTRVNKIPVTGKDKNEKNLNRQARANMLQALHDQPLSVLQSIAASNAKDFSTFYVNEMTKNRMVEKASTIQIAAEMKVWKSYGTSIAFQIVNGLASGPAQAALRNGFRLFIVDTFKEQLTGVASAKTKAERAKWLKDHPQPDISKVTASKTGEWKATHPPPTLKQYKDEEAAVNAAKAAGVVAGAAKGKAKAIPKKVPTKPKVRKLSAYNATNDSNTRHLAFVKKPAPDNNLLAKGGRALHDVGKFLQKNEGKNSDKPGKFYELNWERWYHKNKGMEGMTRAQLREYYKLRYSSAYWEKDQKTHKPVKTIKPVQSVYGVDVATEKKKQTNTVVHNTNHNVTIHADGVTPPAIQSVFESMYHNARYKKP